METKIQHPVMPIIEAAAQYLAKYYVPSGIDVMNFKVYSDFNQRVIYVKFKIHARKRVLQFIKNLGVDIDFSTMKSVRTSNCNDLEFDAVANLDAFRRLVKYARDNHHAVISILPDYYLPLRDKVKDYKITEPNIFKQIRKNINDKKKKMSSLLPIERRAMGLA